MTQDVPQTDAPVVGHDIIFECPHCSKSLEIDARGAGFMIVCPDCQREVQVPVPEGVAEAAPDQVEEMLQSLRQKIDQLEKQQTADRACFKRLADEIVLIQSALDRINEIVEARTSAD